MLDEMVLIVEGWSDHDQLQLAFPGIETIVINGTRFNRYIVEKILAAQEHGKTVYIMTDPDATGDCTAKRIWRVFSDIERINIDPDKARSLGAKGWHYGVEYCSVEYLRSILRPYVERTSKSPSLTCSK